MNTLLSHSRDESIKLILQTYHQRFLACNMNDNDKGEADKGLNQFKKSDKGMEISRRLALESDGRRTLRDSFSTTVNTTPLLKDLYQYITPQHAADWEVLGTLLSVPSGELKAIEAGYPINVKWCCNQMLKKWLEIDTTASWRKLFSVIESPAMSSASGEGNYLC